MDRRRVLLGLGAAAGVGAVGGAAGGLAWVQPRRGWLVPPEDGPVAVTGSPRVVVVGGGLAGISAAAELASRGCRVTLVEQAPHLGGKLGGWDVTGTAGAFPMEHGFHGFFAQYYNLWSLLEAAGTDPADFVAQASYPVLLPDGPPERFTNTTPVWPLNLASVIAGSHRLHPADFREADGLLELMRYRGQETYDAFDDVDFAAWIAARAIPQAMVDVVLRPFGDATLNRIERLSAAEAIRFFHFYFLGNPEGLAFRALGRDCMTAVIDPLRRHLERLGVEIRTSAPVSRLVLDGDRVAGVEVGGGDVPVLLAMVDGAEVAFDARCTHMGCVVQQVPDGFRCPCHGGRFDRAGNPTGGPPTIPLRRLMSPTSTVLDCDAVVLACDVRGVRAIVDASAVEPAFAARVGALGESEPYAVVRWWLDRPVSPERSAFYTTTGFRYTDSLAVYSAFQEPFAAWASSTGGSVVETHAYAIAAADRADADTVAARMRDELSAIFPELRDAGTVHVEAQYQSNFTRWAPGDDARRPGTATPHPNLFLAGDHVKIDAPTALMEAAVMSGRLAANAILRQHGAAPVPIPMVSPTGVLA